MHLIARAMPAIVATVVLVSVSAPAAAAVRICKAPVTGRQREAASEAQARKLALDSWIAEAGKLGPNFVSWQLAINKKLSCQGSALTSYRCQAVGQPCTISQVPPPKGPLPKPKGKGYDI